MKIKSLKLRSKNKVKEPKDKTVGTIMAEKIRAELNNATDLERAQLLNEGMAMIYSRYGKPKTHANSR